MDAAERDRLVMFVAQLRIDLPWIFDGAQPYVTAEVYDRLWPAWEAALARNDIDVMEMRIGSGEYDEELDRAGLSGPELEFKLTGYEAARASARESTQGRPAPRLFKRWLGWLDVVLGSLVSVLGAGEALKELKEGVETEVGSADGA
ncbi:MAG: hypothetical protein U0R51_08290 [Solirubrobacterales bacterium]